MEIYIKKSRLTKALFEQIQFLTKEDILSEEFSVVGWCSVKSKTGLNLKYIVLNDTRSGELRKMLFFSFIVEEGDYLELTNPWPTISNQKIKTEDSGRKLKDLLHKIKREVEQKGQFFI